MKRVQKVCPTVSSKKISTTQTIRQKNDTDTASVGGANPSVADAAKNVCTRDAVELYG